MKKLILSASSISAFKSCPIRFRNAYVLGIRKIEDSESQRVGTNWHTILETAALVPGSDCPCGISDYSKDYDRDTECPICESTGKVPDDIMSVITRVLNRAYEGIEFNDPEAKEIERMTLLHALAGYRWHYDMIGYGEQQEKVVATEQYFSLPLLNPQTGHPVPDVFIEGRIDKLIELANGIAVKEHKSTSKSIDPDSTYWGHLNLDVQTTMYIYAARRMQIEELGEIAPAYSLINTVKYDVYHKPTIRPKKLTQADSKKFVKDGMYCGQKFEVVYEPGVSGFHVNGGPATVELGAKEGSFAIRETPDMFGARLLKDITERPEFYFRCIELTRTDAELKAFEQELYDIAQNMRFMIRSGRFYTNEHQCEATFRCDYVSQCYNRETVDQDHVPDGMKCIFNKENENE